MASPTFLLEIRAIVERYLTGGVSLEAAARDVSSIMGSSILMRSSRSAGAVTASSRTGQVGPRALQITNLPPEQVVSWIGLRNRGGPRLAEVAVGLGGSLEDQPRVMRLLGEAGAHLHLWHHLWRRFGRDAA